LEQYKKFLLSQADKFERVFVVAGFFSFCAFLTLQLSLGNHEFYSGEWNETMRTIESICKERGNLHYLNGSSIIVDGVRVVGGTLWSFIPEDAKEEIWYRLNDYRQIRKRGEEKLKEGEKGEPLDIIFFQIGRAHV